MVYCELGRVPLIIIRKIRLFKYWASLKSTSNCILKTCFDDMMCNENDWISNIRNELDNIGLGSLFLKSNIDKVDINIIKQRLKDNWQQHIFSDINRSSRGTLYQHLIDHFCLQSYLNKPVDDIYRKYITKMRLCSHDLKIESGRYQNLPRNERICECCNLNDLEDEYHFILKCPAYNHLRSVYIKRYYSVRPSMFKLVQLLTSNNVKDLCNLGKYLYKACKLREGNQV